MKKFFKFFAGEFVKMIPPTIFFLVIFLIVAYTRSLMDDRFGVGTVTYIGAIIAALIMGKAILIADALPIWRPIAAHPRLYLITVRTLVYALIALLFQIAEELIPLAREAGSVSGGWAVLLEEVYWPRFWAVHILMLVFLAFYNIIAVTVEVMGAAEFRRMIFAKPSAS